MDLYKEYLDHYEITTEQIQAHLNAKIRPATDLSGIIEFVEALLDMQNKRIIIRSDYDPDGICAGIILYVNLKILGYDVEITFPNAHDGYGLTMKNALNLFVDHGEFDVIITADCGIANSESISFLQENGIDVLVSDHHSGQIELHPFMARAVVNPNRADMVCDSEFKAISGTFVAYKIMQLLHKYHENGLDDKFMSNFEPLVVISTVTDVMPHVDENAYLLRKYKHFTERYIPNMRKASLNREYQNYLNGLEVVLRNIGKLNVHNIGWKLGPALNSPRRVTGESKLGYELFMQTGTVMAQQVYDEILKMNEIRKEMTEYVLKVLEPEEVTVVPDSKYEGIAGLVCAKMCESLDIPTIVFSNDGDLCRGSARAPLGYKLLGLISEMKEILPDAIVSAGGHARAAGIAIKSKYLERFKLEWAKLVRSTEREEFTDFKEPMDLDKYIASGELTLKTIEYGLEDIDELYPFNKTIQEPTFKAHVNLDEQKFVRMKERHLKVFLTKDVNVVVWNYAKRPTVTEFDVIGGLKENNYGGITYQLETFFK